MSRLKAASAQHLQLVQALILILLMLGILPDNLFVPTHSRYKIPSRPEVLANKIPLPLPLYPGNVDSTLTLEVPHYLSNCILRWDTYQHVYMVHHQVPFLNPAF